MSTATIATQQAIPSSPARKKLKTSDLPLASATRAAIEALSHKFMKKGGYDSLRHQIWLDLEKSNFEHEFTSSLLQFAEAELDKNTEQLLKVDRGKATLLLEGAVERAGVYSGAEQAIDELIDAHIGDIEQGIRKLRRDEIGADAAIAEQRRGAKTDEQYAEEAAAKRAAREKVRQDAREKDRAVAEERKKVEAERRKVEEERLAAEREARSIAKAQRDRERERDRDRERDADRDHDVDRYKDDYRDRQGDRRRDRDTQRGFDDDRERRDHGSSKRNSTLDAKESLDYRHDSHSGQVSRLKDEGRMESSSRDAHASPRQKAPISANENALLEQAALNDLISESERSARQSRPFTEYSRDDSAPPPPRKLGTASAINPDAGFRKSSKIGVEDSRSGTPRSELSADKRILGTTGDFHSRESRRYRAERDGARRSPSRERRRSRSAEKLSRHRSRSRSRQRTPRKALENISRRRDSVARSEHGISKIDDASSRGKEHRSHARSRSRSSDARRSIKRQRSTTPTQVDRYIPKAPSDRKISSSYRSSRYDGDSRRRSRRSSSRSRSRSRSRDCDRDRERKSDRRRSDYDSRLEYKSSHRSRDEERDERRRYRSRSRSRSRSRTHRRDSRRERSPSRDRYREKERDSRRDRERYEERARDRSRSRSPRRDRER